MSAGGEPMLAVREATCVYGGRKAVDGVSLELRAGEILALLGPNGSGKSTLLKGVAGIQPISGRVSFLGEDAGARSLAWRAARIAYVGADIQAQFPMTAFEAVLLGRSSQGSALFSVSSAGDRARVEREMERCRCLELRDRDLHTLSGGERQLVALARALVQGARVLLLDESLSRMDLHHQAAVGRLLVALAGEGYAAIVVSHDLNLASEWAGTALLMRQGRTVAHGPIREVLTESNLRGLYPGSELVVAASPASGAPKVFFGRG